MAKTVPVAFVGGPKDGSIINAPVDPITNRPPPRWAGADYRKADPKAPPSKKDTEIAHYVYDIGPSPDLDGPFWRATFNPAARVTLPPRPKQYGG